MPRQHGPSRFIDVSARDADDSDDDNSDDGYFTPVSEDELDELPELDSPTAPRIRRQPQLLPPIVDDEQDIFTMVARLRQRASEQGYNKPPSHSPDRSSSVALPTLLPNPDTLPTADDYHIFCIHVKVRRTI